MTKPEEVYGYRKNPTMGVWEVLISWKGLPPHETTWEVCDDFQQQFPHFHLEDKMIWRTREMLGHYYMGSTVGEEAKEAHV